MALAIGHISASARCDHPTGPAMIFVAGPTFTETTLSPASEA
jgi:hypothetical protein